jgi:glycosyltransferase involved in cell wall biosynthesis
MKKIAIVTDAWFPHVSGVATTIAATKRELEKRGLEVLVIGPHDFDFRVPLPTYEEIKLAPFAGRALSRMLDEFAPDAIHIAVEGPLGLAARGHCTARGLCFTTAYHTEFPEYINVRTGVPPSWIYPFMRWFHAGAKRTMVATPLLKEKLESKGLTNLVLWGRGVDAELFTPDDPLPLPGARPLFMYMGRVSPEKNIGAFLSLDLPGVKYVVGDGPARKDLQRRFPDAVFTGYKFGTELARHLAAADVFVFPSTTDTLGLVMLEANACGVPVAALPSHASRSVIEEGVNGTLSADLREACLRALSLSRELARRAALKRTWSAVTEDFLSHLHDAHTGGATGGKEVVDF